MSPYQKPSITLIGLGAMGSTLASAYLKAQYHLTIWNRTSSRPVVKDLVNAGATFVSDLSKAIDESEVVVFCLIGYDALDQDLKSNNLGQVLKGKQVINLTNGTPRQARAMSKVMKHEMGVKLYIDGGIMATPDMIGTGASKIFVSGEREEEVGQDLTDVIKTLGKAVWFGAGEDGKEADAGMASLHDLAMLSGMYGMFAGAMGAMALMKKGASNGEDVAIATTVKGLLVPTILELVPLLELIATSVDNGNMGANGFPMGMQAIGLRNIVTAFEEAGVDAGLLTGLLRVFDRVVEHGGEEDGMGRVMEVILGKEK